MTILTAQQALLKAQILDLSRQNNLDGLDQWFDQRLDAMIVDGTFLPEHSLQLVSDRITHDLVEYRVEAGIDTVVLGMSGGVDSALTAAKFKQAGWRVIGVTMPIHQEQSETDRGIEACNAIGIEHLHIDLSDLYDATLKAEAILDDKLIVETFEFENKPTLIRRGNIRARLRMITLYNLAAKYRGLVASTDNWSELTAGFWTLHGDVGDLSPIQSLLKSWEVPYLAKINGVPESTYRATPTDGLGIDAGDEAQLGASYLEWDIMALTLAYDPDVNTGTFPERSETVRDAVRTRIAGSWFKRKGPVNLRHAFADNRLTADRYTLAEILDSEFIPHIAQ